MMWMHYSKDIMAKKTTKKTENWLDDQDASAEVSCMFGNNL